MPSLAKTFYDDFLKAPDRLAFLKELVNSTPSMTEKQWLEFKTAPEGRDEKLTEMWSEVLSAFANSGGGVVIWGIKCERDQNGVDCATGFSPVLNPAKFRTRLNDLTHQATDPPVMGVDIEPVDDPEAQGRGYVVCLIPDSRHPPHRAEFPQKYKPYFMRAAHSTVFMSSYMLRRLFYPQTSAILCVTAGVTYEDGLIVIDVTLRNTGTATARDVIVITKTNRLNAQWRPLPSWEPIVYPPKTLKCLSQLHPGGEMKVFRAHEKIDPVEFLNLSFNYWLDVFANDTQRERFDLTFTRRDMEAQKFKDFFPVERDDQ